MSRQLYEFTDRGYQIHGIVHVGMNEGQEIPVYLKNNWGPIIGFEPLYRTYKNLFENFSVEILSGALQVFNCGLGNEIGRRDIRIPYDTSGNDDTPLASLLKEGWRSLEKPDGSPLGGYRVEGIWVWRWDNFWLSGYDALVIDVQGMELEVLKGAERKLQDFKYLVVECSETPIYEGEPPAYEVVNWLGERGFEQITPILPHDDIMFLRRDIGSNSNI